MQRAQAIELIESIASSKHAFDRLSNAIVDVSRESIGQQLLHCGVIPEQFAHDSSEEKLWAKYCDVLLGKAFDLLDIPSEVIRMRGDSADVRGVTKGYSIVADAKAFRLSRTAKNQKDFKIAALDDWRRGDTYACLVAPSDQYPSRSSQIYAQAIARNVTLLSYPHLTFLLGRSSSATLESVWKTAASLALSKDARQYWEAIEDALVAATNRSYGELRHCKQKSAAATIRLAQEGIDYWETVKESYRALSKQEAIARLIKADKIDGRIGVIRNSMNRAQRYLHEQVS